MVFDPNIPQAADLLSDSQNDLLTNNQDLDSSFAVDHTAFSDSTSANGQHKKVTLYQVAADPALTFPASMLYSKNVGVTPNQVTNLYYATKPETGSQEVLQLSGSVSTTTANAGTAGGNITRTVLPIGITIYSGITASFPGAVQRSVLFPVPFSSLLSAVCTPNNSAAQYCSVQPNNSQLLIVNSAAFATNYIAIGLT